MKKLEEYYKRLKKRQLDLQNEQMKFIEKEYMPLVNIDIKLCELNKTIADFDEIFKEEIKVIDCNCHEVKIL